MLTALMLLATVNLFIVAGAWRPLAGTTLIAPWLWCMVALLGIAGCEVVVSLWGGNAAPRWCEMLRYLAATSTFCPPMAVLGAKRPQDRPWQWVVLTLWIVLAIPAIHALILPSTHGLKLHAAWCILLGGLLLLELANYANRRHIGCVLLYIAAQTVLLTPYVVATPDASVRSGRALIAMLMMLAALLLVRHNNRGDTGPTQDLQRLWRRFCAWYGNFWAFRVMSLVNQTAAASGWSVRLWPNGFYRTGDDEGSEPDGPATIGMSSMPPALHRQVHQALRTTLRRFLAHAHLAPSNDSDTR